jgi:hypothetical protein
MIALVLLASCWEVAEDARQRRVWEMEDHDQDLRAAREALRRGDLAAARQAGVGLARPDEVPGLSEAGRAELEQVRALGRSLSEAHDAPSAAVILAGMTAHCAGCHRASGVATPPPHAEADADDLLWLGVVFESEERWVAGVARSEDLRSSAGSWAERRQALAQTLHP